MRGTVARRIRKSVYAGDLSPKYRDYYWLRNKKTTRRILRAGKLRSEYQKQKREHTRKG